MNLSASFLRLARGRFGFFVIAAAYSLIVDCDAPSDFRCWVTAVTPVLVYEIESIPGLGGQDVAIELTFVKCNELVLLHPFSLNFINF